MKGGITPRKWRRQSELFKPDPVFYRQHKERGHHWAGGEIQTPDFLVVKNIDKLKATDFVWDLFSKLPTIR